MYFDFIRHFFDLFRFPVPIHTWDNLSAIIDLIRIQGYKYFKKILNIWRVIILVCL